MEAARVLRNNMLTIPKSVRERMGLDVGDRVIFTEVADGSFIIKKLDDKRISEFLLVDTPEHYNVSREDSSNE